MRISHAKRYLIGLWVLLMVFGPSIRAEAAPPVADGKPWRIAYYEGGPYPEFRDSLYGLLTAFYHNGWLDRAPDAGLRTARELWNWAVEQKSAYLRFCRECYYTAEWEPDQRQTVRERLYRDLADDKADLVLGMGSWVGIDLKGKDPGVPVVLMAVSDALGIGLFRNGEPGNPPWLHVRMDPERDRRAVRIFHDSVDFKTLGVVYRDSVEGRSYASLDTVMEVARERNFKVKTCTMPDGGAPETEELRLLQCYRDLTGEVDALLITENVALNERTLPLLVEHTLAHRIPTFSQAGSTQVRAGILMSISQINFFRLGEFTAETIMRIMAGETPGSLPMVLEDPPVIAVNMMTAKKIGYDISIDVLSASDQIFLNINNENSSESPRVFSERKAAVEDLTEF